METKVMLTRSASIKCIKSAKTGKNKNLKLSYDLYQQVEELRTVGLKYAKALGVPVYSGSNEIEQISGASGSIMSEYHSHTDK
jgi:hypothetical protein